MERATPSERDKLISWRIFLASCEREFVRALRDLTRLPAAQRSSAEEIISELELALKIVRGGLIDGVELPPLLRYKVHRHFGRIPSREEMGLEPRVQRGGLRATEIRLAELERGRIQEPGLPQGDSV